MDQSDNNKLGLAATMCVVLALCIVSFIVANRFVNGGTSDAKNAVSTNIPSDCDIKVAADKIYSYDGNYLHAYNDSGNQIWNYTAGTNSEYTASQYGIALWNDSRLSLLDGNTGHAMASVEMENQIIAAKLGSYYAACVVAPEGNATIQLVDRNGTSIDHLNMSNSTVLDFGFFADGELFWVLTVNTLGTVPACTVSTYRPGKMITGTITDTDQVTYGVMFENDTVLTAGTNYLKYYDYTCKEQTNKRSLIYGWHVKVSSLLNGVPLMALVPNDQADGVAGMHDVWIINGSYQDQLRFPFEAKEVVSAAGKIYAFSNNYVMNIAPGEKAFTTYEVPMRIDKVMGVTDTNKAVVGSGTITYVLDIP